MKERHLFIAGELQRRQDAALFDFSWAVHIRQFKYVCCYACLQMTAEVLWVLNKGL